MDSFLILWYPLFFFTDKKQRVFHCLGLYIYREREGENYSLCLGVCIVKNESIWVSKSIEVNIYAVIGVFADGIVILSVVYTLYLFVSPLFIYYTL